MIWPFGNLRPFCADVIAIDCPWDFQLYSEAGAEKSASAQYETMPLSEIMALPVGHLARGDCLLLMWACEWMPLADRQAVMTTWGFTYKTTIIWRKTTRTGKVRMGPGYRSRTMHEPVHIGTIGNPHHKAFPSIFDGIARQHSRKPEEFYRMVEKHSPKSTRLDLFSRKTRPGWISWGKEATKFDDDESESVKRKRGLPLMPQPEAMPLFENHVVA
ncbi:MT-A70 family methyltransferase [Mesorhizobium silamurunense]|uniref:MT-A70 family methyltransferase n=1 Tax=Mesorhizobium silamurunense TaxID=499528 RepID=UPI0017870DCD|nr:MT-A70 family methyltransferase [Mesorhizobium silamurunense]